MILRSALIGSIIFLLSASCLWSAELAGTCSVHFQGDSTLHGFAGQGECDPFSWEWAPTDSTVDKGEVRIAVAGMDTGNGKRDKKMYKMFSADEHPFIRGYFNNLNPSRLIGEIERQAEARIKLPFELVIRGRTQRVTAILQDFQRSADRLTFHADFPVSLQSYRLKAPSVLGIIRVADRVQVKIDVSLDLSRITTVSHAD